MEAEATAAAANCWKTSRRGYFIAGSLFWGGRFRARGFPPTLYGPSPRPRQRRPQPIAGRLHGGYISWLALFLAVADPEQEYSPAYWQPRGRFRNIGGAGGGQQKGVLLVIARACSHNLAQVVDGHCLAELPPAGRQDSRGQVYHLTVVE